MTDKPTVLLIHGMWSRPRVWEATRAHLEARGHAVLAPALPGHDIAPGDPVPPELAGYGLADYVDALEAVARTVDGPLVVAGHSLGGLLAQLLAVRVQPAGLALLSPAPSADILAIGLEPLRTTWPLVSRWGFWHQTTLIPREAALYGIFNNVPAADAEREVAELIPDSGRVLGEILAGALHSGKPARVDYARLAMPALVVVGTADRITPAGVARATARRLAGPVRYREFDDVGHWLFHAAVLGQVLGEFDAFLDTLKA